jgi:hypothetical protein
MREAEELSQSVGRSSGAYREWLKRLDHEILDLDTAREMRRDGTAQIQERRKELKAQIEYLRRNPLRPRDITELQSSVNLRREKYVEVLNELRECVDRAKPIYEKLGVDPGLKPKSQSKNKGLSQARYKLVERKLKEQEDWLRRKDSPPVRKGGTGKGRNAPGDLPPEF